MSNVASWDKSKTDSPSEGRLIGGKKEGNSTSLLYNQTNFTDVILFPVYCIYIVLFFWGLYLPVNGKNDDKKLSQYELLNQEPIPQSPKLKHGSMRLFGHRFFGHYPLNHESDSSPDWFSASDPYSHPDE
ncbi:MAG: hypothetical protein ACLQQ4_00405 [Bacteroidia bacterium]